jgi:hypothetical protein
VRRGIHTSRYHPTELLIWGLAPFKELVEFGLGDDRSHVVNLAKRREIVMSKKRIKKWKIVLVVAESYTREAGWMTKEEMFRAVKTSIDLPVGIELLSGGATETSKL